jgi:hypothetical protein
MARLISKFIIDIPSQLGIRINFSFCRYVAVAAEGSLKKGGRQP